MAILTKGSQGSAVTELKNQLKKWGYNLTTTALFDTSTYNAVRHFQASHVDEHGQPLVVDGKVGELTLWALRNPRKEVENTEIDYIQMPADSFGGSTLGRAALQAAINELKVGAGEVGGDNKGPWVKKYLQPVGLSDGYSWCAGFTSWCFLQAVGGKKDDMPFKYSAGARNIYNQLRAKGKIVKGTNANYVPLPGDVVIWWRESLASGLGHIGIVHHYKDGFVYTIEGNKAANVAGFAYVKTRIDKLLGFGRIQ